ncbi:MAG: HPF/RaiA family ribosome-associated protein [Chloroherpetonaceae bacterium]|nr:HPF/RaiA family ribosome-associated protein [Chloroherpetonaceae bacterium]
MRSIHNNRKLQAQFEGAAADQMMGGSAKRIEPDDMQFQFTLRHANSSPQLEEYALNAVQEFKKYFNGVSTVHVVLDHQKNDYVKNKFAEIKVTAIGNSFISKEFAETYEKAIESCVESIKRQLIKYKEKIRQI